MASKTYNLAFAINGESKFYTGFMKKYNNKEIPNVDVVAIFSSDLRDSTINASRVNDSFFAQFLAISPIITNESVEKKSRMESRDALNFFEDKNLSLIVTDNFDLNVNYFRPKINTISANYGSGNFSDSGDLSYSTSNMIPINTMDLIVQNKTIFYSKVSFGVINGDKFSLFYKEYDFSPIINKYISKNDIKDLQEYPQNEKLLTEKIPVLFKLSNQIQSQLIDGKVEIMNYAIDAYLNGQIRVKEGRFGLSGKVLYNGKRVKDGIDISTL